jgi:hypothetical protein
MTVVPAERHRRPLIPIETLHALEERTAEVLLREVGTLLDDGDAAPGVGELLGDDRAARARADDADVDFALDAPAQLGVGERVQARPRGLRRRVEAALVGADRHRHRGIVAVGDGAELLERHEQ